MPSSARPYESYRSFLHAQANRRPDGAAGDCQKTIKRSPAIEQRGKSERGKKPLSRSIKQFSELFKFRKLDRSAGRKDFFDTLPPPRWGGGSLVVYFFSPNSSANAANFGIARSSRSSGTQ